MTERSTVGHTPATGFDPAPITGPFSGPPGAGRALALALGCPDLFLIEAAAGPDRDGFAAAAAVTAAKLGRTVLVVTPDGPTANNLFGHFVADRDPPAVRATALNETADTLPEPSRARSTSSAHEGPDSHRRTRADGIADELRGLTAECIRFKTERDGIPSDVEARRVSLRQQVHAVREQLARLTPLREAKEQGRIWSGLFWKATFAGNVTTRISELERQLAGGEAEVRELDELATKRARLDSELALLSDRAERLTTEPDTEWDLPRTTVPLVRPIVVAPLSAFGHDPITQDPFDHLVVTFAERLSAENLAALQRCSARCILIGSRFGRLAGPLFAELYAERDTSPWVAEAGRLVFRLKAVPPHRRNELRGEPLADRPEIELRFLRHNGDGDDLAEVAFPDVMTPAEARTWLAAELGVVRLTPCGRHHWHDGPGPLRACWHLADCVPEPPKSWAHLGNGVEVLVVGTGADSVTAAVTFDPSRWDRSAAEAWLAEAIAESPPRAVRLPRAAVVQPCTPRPEPATVG